MGAIELNSQELELLSDESLVPNPDVEFTSCVTLSQGFHLCLHKKTEVAQLQGRNKRQQDKCAQRTDLR